MLTPFPLWIALVAIPVPFLVLSGIDRRYGTWLAWFVRIEGRAVLVSLKASLVTALILAFTWPLYFVPFVG